jgi:hypothetical protein
MTDKVLNSPEKQRLNAIREYMEQYNVKGNARDFVVILNAKTIYDVSGAYEIKAALPDPIEAGNHVWVRGMSVDDKEVIASAIVKQDHYDSNGVDSVLITDEYKEWVVSREDVRALPLCMTPMLIHKSKIHKYLGDDWGETFWNNKLKMRRSRIKI